MAAVAAAEVAVCRASEEEVACVYGERTTEGGGMNSFSFGYSTAAVADATIGHIFFRFDPEIIGKLETAEG